LLPKKKLKEKLILLWTKSYLQIFWSFLLLLYILSKACLLTPIKRKEKEVQPICASFHVYVLPKGKKKDKGCLWMVQIKSGRLRMTQFKIWLASNAPDQIQLPSDG
jgi:hypothetical protein